MRWIGLSVCSLPTAQVAQPSLLFLDEPTSGLDATSSQAVLNGLKLLSGRGMSSIMVIHQPRYSIYRLYDQVCDSTLLVAIRTALPRPASVHIGTPLFHSSPRLLKQLV